MLLSAMNYDIISLSLYSDKYSESEVCTKDTCLIDHSGDIIHIKFWTSVRAHSWVQPSQR